MIRLVPITLREANDFVNRLHRHHRATVGHRWSIGVAEDGRLCGVAICERAKARLESRFVAEVTRVCTDGTKNACSILYAACARAAEAMGYDSIKTFIFASESGTSLKASGWIRCGDVPAQSWSRPSRQRIHKEHTTEPKVKWVKILRDSAATSGAKDGDAK